MKKSNNMNIKAIIIVLMALLVFLTACSNQNNYDDYEIVYLSASWERGYRDVQEMAESCDLAAYVTIKDMRPDGRYSSHGILMTVYTAEVVESLYGEQQGDIEIIMTGGINDSEKKIYEIDADPLMMTNEKYFIFATKNESGTYTILSGSQGRFEIIDDMVYSLNVCNNKVKKK